MKELLAFLIDLIFGFLKGKDENKHKRIGALILICLMLAPTVLYTMSAIERWKWYNANPRAFPAPTMMTMPNHPEVRK